MVKYCCAPGCFNAWRPNKNITFHRFPYKRPEILSKWIQAVRLKHFTSSVYAVICSDHFTPDCYLETSYNRKLLKKEAVPTIFFRENDKKPNNDNDNDDNNADTPAGTENEVSDCTGDKAPKSEDKDSEVSNRTNSESSPSEDEAKTADEAPIQSSDKDPEDAEKTKNYQELDSEDKEEIVNCQETNSQESEPESPEDLSKNESEMNNKEEELSSEVPEIIPI